MDLKKLKPKLIGDEDERAVSPVIGVVLMVAVTVILAAVIAAFVMGMGDDMESSQEATGAASFDVNDGEGVTVSLASEGNAEYWEVRGSIYDSDGGEPVSSDDYPTIDGAGDSLTLSCTDEDTEDDYYLDEESGGTVSVAASMDASGDGSFTTIGEDSFDCDV